MSSPSKVKDQVIICCDCNKEFMFDTGTQQFFLSKNFPPPKRCFYCKKEKKKGEKKKVQKQEKIDYSSMSKDERTELLRQEFAIKQIPFREDSKLCRRFIKTGKTNTVFKYPNQIAKRMAQMRFLNTNTDYLDLLEYYEECFKNKSRNQVYKYLTMIERMALKDEPYPSEWPWYKKPSYEEEFPVLE